MCSKQTGNEDKVTKSIIDEEPVTQSENEEEPTESDVRDNSLVPIHTQTDCNNKPEGKYSVSKSDEDEVATEGVYEQEDSDQDDSIDQPGDIKKGHSLNDVQKTGVEIANSQRQTEENTMDYSGASSSPPARRSKHCIIKVAWKVSNSELHESGTMSL
ncbi:uncharacterized protein [Apostichopus japonicus]|uniref:uncharacterized protein isoform X1 n=1 Tax=Stichopus japonicus TaxID=307972 RepID=UPI003AB24473